MVVKKITVYEYEDKFFETARRMGYIIETCKGGSFRGERQIDFCNKKLHAGHIRMLYPLVKEKGPIISYGDFEKLVPGRPCAVPYFNEINRKVFDEKSGVIPPTANVVTSDFQSEHGEDVP